MTDRDAKLAESLEEIAGQANDRVARMTFSQANALRAAAKLLRDLAIGECPDGFDPEHCINTLCARDGRCHLLSAAEGVTAETVGPGTGGIAELEQLYGRTEPRVTASDHTTAAPPPTSEREGWVLVPIEPTDEWLEVGRKAIEDALIDWRDDRLSEPFRSNGLVIREKDGEASSIIRFGPEIALRIGLRAMLAARPTQPRVDAEFQRTFNDPETPA